MFIFKGLFWSMLVPLAFYVAGFDFDERGMVFLSYILIHAVFIIWFVYLSASQDLKPSNEYLIDNIKKEMLEEIIYLHECDRANGGESDLSRVVRSRIELLNKG